MKLVINSETVETPNPKNLIELLEFLGMSNKPVVIEHNKNAILTQDYGNVLLADGDKIELITIAAGG